MARSGRQRSRKTKKALVSKDVDARKIPRVAPAVDWRSERPVWRIAGVDLEHDEFGWGKVSRDALVKSHEFLAQMERMTWKEIFAQRCKAKGDKMVQKHRAIDVSAIASRNPAAGKRLKKLPQTRSAAQLMKFRLGSKHRLYGVMQGHVCSLLWCDPNHRVYPVSPSS